VSSAASVASALAAASWALRIVAALAVAHGAPAASKSAKLAPAVIVHALIVISFVHSERFAPPPARTRRFPLLLRKRPFR
jgi:hypothetical protein